MNTVTLELPEEVSKIIRRMGWSDLTDIQKEAFGYIIEGYNVLITAPTGYGKTEAAMLPILSMMLKESVKPVAVLYITPLKALINNLKERIERLVEGYNIIVARKHGDLSAAEKTQRLRRVPHILLTTPEGLKVDLDWAPKFRQHLRNVKWIVIDEVHELVSSKRGIQLSLLLERLKHFTSYDFQRIALSATIGNPEEVLDFVSGSSKRPKKVIKTKKRKVFEIVIDSIPSNAKNFWEVSAEKILKHVEFPSIIFVNTRFAAERLHTELAKRLDNKVYVHHSSVSKEIRTDVENKLREGSDILVIATKTLELGIDVGQLKKVIQFRTAGSAAALVQRIGRSGHKVNSVARGTVLAIEGFEVLEALAEATLALKGKVEKPQILRKALDVLARELIGICLQYKQVPIYEAYEILRGAYAYRDMSYEEFNELVEYLVKNGVLSKNNEYIKVGPTFYKIWRFKADEKRWWSKSFTEFFSTIVERETFSVKWQGKHIGDLDAIYVYKFLRVGSIIRLGGRSWKIVEIDDDKMKIEVELAEGSGEVPIWRSDEHYGSSLMGEGVELVFKEAWKDLNIKLSNEAMASLSKVFEWYESHKVPKPRRDIIYLESVNDEIIITGLFGKRLADTIAHMLMYLLTKEEGGNVEIKTSSAGVAVKSKLDPLSILREISEEEVEQILVGAMERSPYLVQTIKEIQYILGKIGKVTPDDGLVYKEAVRQAIEKYLDRDGVVEFIKKLKNGEITVIDLRDKNILSHLAEYTVKMPPMKPWLRLLDYKIESALKDFALTVDELVDVLNLSAKTIENKLKDLRKKGSKPRLFAFIDVEMGEWRWSLVESADVIKEMEEFKSSFEPYDPYETFVVYLREDPKSEYTTKYFRPIELMKSPEKIINTVPFDEIYEVKVFNPNDPLLKNTIVRYYHVPKKLLPLLLLNATTYIQQMKN